MHVFPRRPARLAAVDRRLALVLVGLAALLVLLLAALLLNRFRTQRLEAQRNRVQLAAWESLLLTATPAAFERARLESQLEVVQRRFAEASGRLPGTEVEVAILARIYEAATRSGVEITTLAEAGPPVQEGSLVGWRYRVAAEGALDPITEFAARLEQEAFPSATLRDPLLSEREPGLYVISGDLTVFGSTLSTGALVGLTPVPPDQLAATLREEAAAALDRGDYELALSFLLRLKAFEPQAGDVDQRLYEAFLAYGDSLLAEGRVLLAQEQYEAALALDPDGQEAIARLLALAPLLTPTLGPIVVATDPGGAPIVVTATGALATSTPPPTTEPPATRTPIPTRPPIPTRTPAPPPPTRPPPATSTPVGATSTPILTPTATVTGTPPTATPTSPPPGTPNPYPFGARGTFYLPNCGLTQVKGTVFDENNRPLNGVTVRVWWDGAPFGTVYSLPTGSDPTRGPGEWDVVLANFPKAGDWKVAVVNRDDGALLSPIQEVTTDLGPCQPGGAGRQVVIQDFVRFGSGPGVPGATLTPSPRPTSSTTPTRTPTITLTPSITPTPTPTPIVFNDPVDPNMPIPDDPASPLLRTISVPDQFTLRGVRVFLNVEHDDVGDLRVTLIHPDGTRAIVHDQGQRAGQTDIRRWFDLTAFNTKSSNGTWILEVTDTIEGRVGELIQWSLELQP